MDNRVSGKMTKEEIKTILINHYHNAYGGGKINRELVVLSPNSNAGADCTFFALAGTSPKGYGIYISEKRVLCLYDIHGKRFKEYYLRDGIIDL